METQNAERDRYFDNAKFFLILLVVAGHAIEPLIYQKGGEAAKGIYLWLYSFHMPAFILISGYFSKGFGKESRRGKLISRILAPYLVFQALYSLFDWFVLQGASKPLSLSFLTPYWTMWFLLSYFCWQVLLPVFDRLRFPVAAAVALAVLAGYSSQFGYFMSFSRTLVFFPFFLAGHYLSAARFEGLLKVNRIFTAAVFAGLLAYFIRQAPFIYPHWFYGSLSYGQINPAFDSWSAGACRLAAYGASALACLCFFSLVPKQKTFFSEMGERTMVVYLLHGFAVKAMAKFGFYNLFPNPLIAAAAAFAAGVILVFLLSLKPVSAVFRPFAEPSLKWLLKSSSEQKSAVS